MNITVDGNKHDMGVQQNQTLGPVYQQLVDSLAQSGKVVTSVEVNGEHLSSGRIWNFASSAISEIQDLDLLTREVVEMVHETMEYSDRHLELLCHETEKTATMFRLGEELEAQERLGTCISGLQWFLKALSALRGMMKLDFNSLPLKDTTVEAGLEEFVPIVEDLLAAQSDGDVVLLADILEYEMIPRLTVWRSALPELEENLCKSMNISTLEN